MDSWDFGRPLQGYRWDVPRARGSVLLLHGYGEHTGRYTHVVEALNGAGFNVFAYDQRGHGRSEGRRALFRVADLVSDHQAAHGWLRDQPGVGPLFALGHSLGGLVAARSVLQDARGLRGVVLSSPALIVGQDQPALLRAVSGLVAAVAPRMLVGSVTGGILSRREDVDTLFKADPLCYQGRVQARSGHEMMRGGAPLWPGLSNWTLPTLVIHGDDDRLITIEGSRRFAQAIASSDKELWEVQGGYHELFNDLDSEQALQKVTRWLRARVAGPAEEGGPTPSALRRN